MPSLIQALRLGRAAEHLVCADLILLGHDAFLAPQGSTYDVLVETASAFYRVQVKATFKSRNVNSKGKNPTVAYPFYVRRRGKNGLGDRLSREHCDIVACVAMDIKAIAYLSIDNLGQTVTLFPPGFKYPLGEPVGFGDITTHPFSRFTL